MPHTSTGDPLPQPGLRHLPDALACLARIVPGEDGDTALFLDFDGTLTPIVASPDAAVLNTSMRATLERLAGLCELAIISGRDLADVRARVGIHGIWYAGSHGFDIAGPDAQRRAYQEGCDYLPVLAAAERQLRDRLAAIPGCLVERKRFSIAVHYRQVAEAEALRRIRDTVDAARDHHPGLRLTPGKKLLELQPDIDWDKGKALHWLMQTLDMDPGRFRPVYIGDDVTDEDAFREVAADGAGILVAAADRPTCADYRLSDPPAVERFLQRLADILAARQS